MEIQKEIDSKNSQAYLTDSDQRYIKKLKGKLRDEKIFDKYEFLFKKETFSDSGNDDWGEPNSMEKLDNRDYSLEDIVDMPVESDWVSEDKTADVDNFPMNPVKTITIKKKAQNREKPKDIEIQEYAETLYEQYGFGTGYEKSLFIAELSEKYPGLDNYEKYYDRIKLFQELGI